MMSLANYIRHLARKIDYFWSCHPRPKIICNEGESGLKSLDEARKKLEKHETEKHKGKPVGEYGMRYLAASYDREKYKPGYKGKFVISAHDAIKAGKHWDIRIQMPLKEGGTTYRSFVNKKRQIPSGDTKIFMPETEDHTPQQAFFTGTIPEGEYGAGTVKIYDKGTYELLEVEGDKKYVIDFQGKKLKGQYALVKYQNGFLWIKVKEKKASVVDYPRPTMCLHIWNIEKDPPELWPEIKRAIFDAFNRACQNADLNPTAWLRGLYLAGSITGYTYREDSDLDIDITYDSSKLREHKDFKNYTGEILTKKLQGIFKPLNKKRVLNTPHTFSFMVLEEGDEPISDGVFDLKTNEWIRGPIQLPENFDPDKAFIKARLIAMDIGAQIDILIGKILQTVSDLKILDQYIEHHNKLSPRKIEFKNRLKILCENLNSWHDYIRSLPRKSVLTSNPIYPSLNIGPNWELNNLVFKYLSRYGYSYPVHIIFDRLKNESYLDLVDSYIPDN